MLQALDLEQPKTLHEAVEEQLIYETAPEDSLEGFWKEENNEAVTTFEGFNSK